MTLQNIAVLAKIRVLLKMLTKFGGCLFDCTVFKIYFHKCLHAWFLMEVYFVKCSLLARPLLDSFQCLIVLAKNCHVHMLIKTIQNPSK